MISILARLLISIPFFPTYKAARGTVVPTATPIPTETTAEDALNAMVGFGLGKLAILTIVGIVVVALFAYAWYEVRG